MFLGEFQHSLDAKGRVILPAEFRAPLAGGAVLTKGLDGCLAVYEADVFEGIVEQVRESARRGARERQVARSFFGGARRFVPDKQGRVAIPPNLREFAQLERDVTVVGVDNRIEIWDTAQWQEHEAQGQADIATPEGLEDIGII